MKEGHFLFNDALNTLYLRLYDVGHKVDICGQEDIGLILT